MTIDTQKLREAAASVRAFLKPEYGREIAAAADIIEALEAELNHIRNVPVRTDQDRRMYAKGYAAGRKKEQSKVDAANSLVYRAVDRCVDKDAEIARLREALTAIEQWEIPLVESRGEAVPMSVAYGSNGVRDYFRGVARAVLAQERS